MDELGSVTLVLRRKRKEQRAGEQYMMKYMTENVLIDRMKKHERWAVYPEI